MFARQFVDQAAANNEKAGTTFDYDWCGVTQLAWDDNAAKKLGNMLDGGFPDALIRSLNVEETEQVTGVETGFHSVNYPLGGWLCPQA